MIFFDGVCGLCNRFIDFVLTRDKRHVFRYAPLQGETARRELPARAVDGELRSVVVLDEKGIHEKSRAVLRVLHHLGGWYRLGLIFILLPRSLRDLLYDFVARRRYAWFGRRETCRLPDPGERELFLG